MIGCGVLDAASIDYSLACYINDVDLASAGSLLCSDGTNFQNWDAAFHCSDYCRLG